uniref:UPAR/Ly6 domain-containing protein n=1 Tax=Hippocampus comes TaxID=109280 RepID=A0A3Q2Z372_HIPCM
ARECGSLGKKASTFRLLFVSHMTSAVLCSPSGCVYQEENEVRLFFKIQDPHLAYYGVVHVLSAQGCVDARLCGNRLSVSHMGVEYRLRHSCCCKDKCNMTPTSQDVLKMLLGVLTEKGENATPLSVSK